MKKFYRDMFNVNNNLNRSCLSSKTSTAVLLAILLGLSACAAPAAGPSTARIMNSPAIGNSVSANVKVINLTDAAIERAESLHRRESLLDQLGDVAPYGTIVGRGDILAVSIWKRHLQYFTE